jgi:uridine kinase
MDFIFNQYKDIIVIVGDNDSGKTSLVQKFIIAKMDKKNIYVINASHQDDWRNYVPQDNIFNPAVFDIDWLEKVLLLIASSKSKNITLIIDDIDNFDIKYNIVIKSIAVNLRHLNVGLIITSRSLIDIPRVIYKQSRYLFLGYQASDYDINYIGTVIGYENARKLKQLSQYIFMVWSRKTHEFSFIRLSASLFK